MQKQWFLTCSTKNQPNSICYGEAKSFCFCGLKNRLRAIDDKRNIPIYRKFLFDRRSSLWTTQGEGTCRGCIESLIRTKDKSAKRICKPRSLISKRCQPWIDARIRFCYARRFDFNQHQPLREITSWFRGECGRKTET
jgi:hypothetical protein